MEVENTEAATNNDTEANDVVMAEDNVEPEANVVPEAHVQPEDHVDAEATFPSPRPHTIEQAFDHGQLVTMKWPIMVPPTAPGSQYDYHVEQRPQVQKPKPRLPRLPGAATSPGSFGVNSFRAHNTFFDSAHTPYLKPKISSVDSGVINSATITPVFYTIKSAYFLICVWTLKPLLVCLALKKP